MLLWDSVVVTAFYYQPPRRWLYSIKPFYYNGAEGPRRIVSSVPWAPTLMAYKLCRFWHLLSRWWTWATAPSTPNFSISLWKYTWYLSTVKLSLAFPLVIQWIIMANWNIDWKHLGSNFPIYTLYHLLARFCHSSSFGAHSYVLRFLSSANTPIIVWWRWMSWEVVYQTHFARQQRNWLWIWTELWIGYLFSAQETPLPLSWPNSVPATIRLTATLSVTATAAVLSPFELPTATCRKMGNLSYVLW